MAPDLGASLGEEVTARKTGRELLFQATTAKQLSKALRRVNPYVPPRHEKRQTWESERWTVVRLLKSLPRFRLPYPVSLVHHDKPDFQLTKCGRRIAIEAVEAVSQIDAHKARVIGGLVAAGAMANPIQSVVLRKPSDLPLTNAQAAIPDTDGHPFIGDAVEKNWTDAMKHFIGGKLSKFPCYSTADERWLMVYDNWNSVMLDLKDGSRRLHEWLTSEKAFETLDSIFIIHDKELVEFTFAGFNIRPLRAPKQ